MIIFVLYYILPEVYYIYQWYISVQMGIIIKQQIDYHMEFYSKTVKSLLLTLTCFSWKEIKLTLHCRHPSIIYFISHLYYASFTGLFFSPHILGKCVRLNQSIMKVTSTSWKNVAYTWSTARDKNVFIINDRKVFKFN